MDNRTIGIGLVVAAVIVTILFTPLGAGIIDDLPDSVSGQGKKIDCDFTIDVDSINTARCEQIDTCRPVILATQFFGLDLNPVSDSVELRLVYRGTEMAAETYKLSNFGVNKGADLEACLPGDATTVRAQLRNDNGVIEAEQTVVIS